jgi:hypothetical protein
MDEVKSDFEIRMEELGTALSSEAKELISLVLTLETNKRFADRTQLPANFASKALKIVKGDSQQDSAS